MARDPRDNQLPQFPLALKEDAELGKRFNLFSLFGWFDSSPYNLGPQEKSILSKSGSVGSSLGSMNRDSIQQFYNSFTSPSPNLQTHIHEMQEMAMYELVNPVLETYAEEMTQPDSEKGKTLWFKCSDADVEKDLNLMLKNIGAEDWLQATSYNLAAVGNDFRRVLYKEGEGVVGCTHVPVQEVRRVYDPNTKRLIGFAWDQHEPPECGTVAIQSKKFFAPWEFVHFRRLANNYAQDETEYGTGILECLFPIYRRIKMSVDSMVMYRNSICPSRLAVTIDTGTKTPIEMAEYLNEYRNLFMNLMSYDPNNRSYETRYNPMAFDSIIWVPKPKDDQTSLDILPGQDNVPDVPDITTLMKLFFGGSRVPKAYLGFEEDSGGLSKNALCNQDMRFARMVRTLRRPLVAGFLRLAEIHLALKGKNPKDYQIEVEMSRICALEDEIKANILQLQVNVAQQLADLCDKLEIGKREIIELVFRDLLTNFKTHTDILRLSASLASGQELAGGLGLESSTADKSIITEAKKAFKSLMDNRKTLMEGENTRVSWAGLLRGMTALHDSMRPWSGILLENKEGEQVEQKLPGAPVSLIESYSTLKTEFVREDIEGKITECVKAGSGANNLAETRIKVSGGDKGEYLIETAVVGSPSDTNMHESVKSVSTLRTVTHKEKGVGKKGQPEFLPSLEARMAKRGQ